MNLKIKIVTTNPLEDIVNYLETKHITYQLFNSNIYTERKKGFAIKGSCSARLDPFIAVYDSDKLVKAFYSEANEVTLSNLKNFIENYE